MESSVIQQSTDYKFLSDGNWETENPEYKLKIITFANNTADYIMTRLKPKRVKERFYGMLTTYQKTLTDEQKAQKELENIERSARRAKQAIHHLIRQIGADHMLTLSTRENIQDKDKFFEIFTRFIRLVREKGLVNGKLKTMPSKRDYAYVAVPELQERGAYHMHIACVGRQDLDLLRACWYVALGGSESDSGTSVLGQIDVQYHKKRFSGLTEIHKTFKLVGYLTKYIAKSFEVSHQLGEKRYSSTRSVPKPIVNNQNLVAMFDAGDKPFVDSIKEVLSIAEFHGLRDLQLWNRGLDVFVLRGTYND